MGGIFLAVLVISIVYMVRERRLSREHVIQNPLTNGQKILIWILCIFNPIIAGAVFYYGWRKQLPIKAKQANQISLWAFLIELILFGIFFFSFILLAPPSPDNLIPQNIDETQSLNDSHAVFDS